MTRPQPMPSAEREAPLPPSASLWWQSHELPHFPPLAEELRVDTVIIGGGVTGLSLALRLARAGQAVAVVERRRLASGTTGGSTAHLTAALDVPWDVVAQRFGDGSAQVVADAVALAIASIAQESRSAPGAAGFARVPGYRFATDESSAQALDREAVAAERLGLAVSRVPLPGPLRATRALRFDAQAEIDPVAYVAGLVRSFVGLGGRVFEQSPVVAATDDEVRVAEGRSIRAATVVHATHTPIGVDPAVQLRLVPFTSYVVTARLPSPLDAALFWDCEDPYHYVRSTAPDRRVVLIGGEDHRVGRCADPAARSQALESWARERFGELDVVGRWSAELFETPDGLPFVGASPGSRQLVAAGFAGTGITFGTVAAALLADLVLGREHPTARVLSPARLGPPASWPRLGREGVAASWRFLADRVRAAVPRRARDVAPDSGVVTMRSGRPIALYRDPSGELHRLSARCTHLGCVVQWNDLEKTWDCPCHGGRYHRTGKVLYGPPTRDLERLEDG